MRLFPQHCHALLRLLDGQRRYAFLDKGQVSLRAMYITEAGYLEDATLLPCNVLQGLPQNSSMVQAERGDSGHNWLRNDIGAIVSSAHADLKDRRVDLKHAVRMCTTHSRAQHCSLEAQGMYGRREA